MNMKAYKLKKIRKKQDHLGFLKYTLHTMQEEGKRETNMLTLSGWRWVSVVDLEQQIFFTRQLIYKDLCELREIK